MQTRRGSHMLLIALSLFAAPASAQWSVYYQKEKGSAWQEVTTADAEKSEHMAREQASLACAGAVVRGYYKISPQYAAKVISPDGKETVLPCGASDSAEPSKDAPESR